MEYKMGNNKRPFPNKDIFEKIDTEEKAYWLGFLYADGCVSSKDNDYRIELSLAEKDYEHMVKFKNFIGLDNKISYREKTKAYRYCFRSKKLKDDLIKLGCVPKKSLILKFPTKEQVPDYLLRHFIRGYIDGDGYIANTENCFSIGFIGTEDFIKEFLNRLPLEVNKEHKIQNVHRKDGAKSYHFSSCHDVYYLLKYLYDDSTIYLDRKYQKYEEIVKYGNVKNKKNWPFPKEI